MPESNVQAPVPVVGVFAAITVLAAQTDCDGPAAAIEGVSSLRMVTVSLSTGQPEPPIVQIN